MLYLVLSMAFKIEIVAFSDKPLVQLVLKNDKSWHWNISTQKAIERHELNVQSVKQAMKLSA